MDALESEPFELELPAAGWGTTAKKFRTDGVCILVSFTHISRLCYKWVTFVLATMTEAETALRGFLAGR